MYGKILQLDRFGCFNHWIWQRDVVPVMHVSWESVLLPAPDADAQNNDGCQEQQDDRNDDSNEECHIIWVSLDRLWPVGLGELIHGCIGPNLESINATRLKGTITITNLRTEMIPCNKFAQLSHIVVTDVYDKIILMYNNWAFSAILCNANIWMVNGGSIPWPCNWTTALTVIQIVDFS